MITTVFTHNSCWSTVSTWLFPCLSQTEGLKITEIRSSQSGRAPQVLPNNPKAKLPKNDVPKRFCHSIPQLKTILTKFNNKIQLIERLIQKLSFI